MRVETAMCDYDCRESSEIQEIFCELMAFGFRTGLIFGYYGRLVGKGFSIFLATVHCAVYKSQEP